MPKGSWSRQVPNIKGIAAVAEPIRGCGMCDGLFKGNLRVGREIFGVGRRSLCFQCL